jgi:stalled ribosome rescue protein Dom34
MKIKKIFDKFFEKEKVIISLTTIPTRLVSEYGYDMKFCIKSLLEQNNKDYEIHLNIPFVYKKTGEDYVIPNWLTEMVKENPKLKIFRTEDYGTITKLLPTITRIENPNTIIIVVDDDLVYHHELVNQHIKNQQKWQNNPVGYDGMRSRNEDGTFSSFFNDIRDYYYSANYRDSIVDILQHYKSISYKRKYFDDDFFNFITEMSSWNDDLVVSSYFAKKKIKRICTYYHLDKDCKTKEEWESQLRHSFPIIRHTEHRSDEGCNIERQKNENNNENIMYNIIDNSY